MSYCVHCGVKLAPSEARCPLCQTPVVDPVTPYDPSVPKEFPTRVREQHLEINPGATLVLAAVLLAVPSLICLFVDLLVSGGLTWSPDPIRCLFDDFLRGASACSMPKESVSLVGCGG